jgi:hypothetical protein
MVEEIHRLKNQMKDYKIISTEIKDTKIDTSTKVCKP